MLWKQLSAHTNIPVFFDLHIGHRKQCSCELEGHRIGINLDLFVVLSKPVANVPSVSQRSGSSLHEHTR